MPAFNVKFFNKVSGWLHSELEVIAANAEAAVKAACEAFNDVHAYSPARYDEETSTSIPEHGTPGHSAALYSTSAAPVDDVVTDPLTAALNKRYPTVSVGGVQQESVSAESVAKE